MADSEAPSAMALSNLGSSGFTSSSSSDCSSQFGLDDYSEVPSMLDWGVSATSRLIDDYGRPRRGYSEPPRSVVPVATSDQTHRRHRSSHVYRTRRHHDCSHHDCRSARRHSTHREREFTRDFFLIVAFCFVLACLLLCIGRLYGRG